MAKVVQLTPKVDDAGHGISRRIATPADAMRVLEVAAEKARAGVRGCIATVVARHGSAPGTPGQKLFAGADGSCAGTVGGGAVEREVIDALDVMLNDEEPKHHARSFKLGAELGMCCGGSIDLWIEPIEALTSCLIIGGGHVATAAAPLLARVGFAVTLCDEREAWAGEARLPGVRSIVGEFDDVGKDLPRRGAVLVMTHDHALDQRAIEWALTQKFAYVGGVGSRAKAQRTRDRLEARGFSQEDRARIRMPIGVDIGARLPEEIAVAIAAEMVAWRKKNG
ncbi:MAG: XdhC/CoxI family protein [Polyangiaceae bacterium]